MDISEGSLSPCLSVQPFPRAYYLCEDIVEHVRSVARWQLHVIFSPWSVLSSVQQGLEARERQFSESQ